MRGGNFAVGAALFAAGFFVATIVMQKPCSVPRCPEPRCPEPRCPEPRCTCPTPSCPQPICNCPPCVTTAATAPACATAPVTVLEDGGKSLYCRHSRGLVVRHLRMWLDDPYLWTRICANELWDGDEETYFDVLSKMGGDIVEIGANIGYFTQMFVYHRFYDGVPGKVVAVEANPQTYQMLSSGVAHMGAGRVQLLNRAAAEDSGDGTTVVKEVIFCVLTSSLHSHIAGAGSACEEDATRSRVPTLTAAQLLQNYTDMERQLRVVKVDADYAEFMILDSLLLFMRRTRQLLPHISIEVNWVRGRVGTDWGKWYDDLVSFYRSQGGQVLYLANNKCGALTRQVALGFKHDFTLCLLGPRDTCTPEHPRPWCW